MLLKDLRVYIENWMVNTDHPVKENVEVLQGGQHWFNSNIKYENNYVILSLNSPNGEGHSQEWLHLGVKEKHEITLIFHCGFVVESTSVYRIFLKYSNNHHQKPSDKTQNTKIVENNNLAKGVKCANEDKKLNPQDDMKKDADDIEGIQIGEVVKTVGTVVNFLSSFF